MKRMAIALTLVFAVLATAESALALGTPAGTVIQNRATATFDLGAATNLTAYSSTVSTTVDELIDVMVDNAGIGTTYVVVLPAQNQPLLYNVTNNGNGTESFVLTITESPSDDFDSDPPAVLPATAGVEIYIDDGDAVFEESDADYATSLVLLADQSVGVWVIQDIPSGAGSAGDVSQITLTASHQHAPFSSVPGTVYAGQGDGGGDCDAVLGVNGGTGSATKAYQLALTALNLIKSGAVADPMGGVEPVPGATITYTIEFVVTWAGSIGNLVIEDPVPENTTFVPASITAGPIPADDASLIGSTVTVSYASTNISAVAGTQTITFGVTID